jgi:hypothetical protein
VFKGSGFYETDYKRASDKARHERKKGDGGPTGADKSPPPAKPDAPKADSKAD